ncbi:MAG TPA: hypothetical protein VF613_08350 [Longimicrobium sp.]|jgi:hypothetical protein
MTDPRFQIDELDPTRAAGDLPDAFQRFVQETLEPEIPGLKCYPAGGKDGAIDLRASGETQTVVECKVVGTDSEQAVRQRWEEVRRSLERNLADPAGPLRGQAQYRPWYDGDRPVRRYVFCTTARLKNANQEDSLTGEIQRFFERMAAYPHLAHLTDIDVEVLDWGDFLVRLPPHRRLRWFRRTRPAGLVPLDNHASSGRFREYLRSARLPYYSRAAHLANHPAPPGVPTPDEPALLAAIEGEGTHGLLVSGAGGYGKTRLTLELAWRAHEEGWTVLRAGPNLRAEALVQIAGDLTPDDRVLILFDYVETHPGFPEVATELSNLNLSYRLRLRYVANCRGSYVPSFQVFHDYTHLDLSPPAGTAAQEWLRGYRSATVRHILGHRDLVTRAEYVAACREVPVLAVFLCWLVDQGRKADLQGLVDEPDFGKWVLDRLAKSFPERTMDREVAQLFTLLPLTTRGFLELPQDRFGLLLDHLAVDGWIERVADASGTGSEWAAIHDVLADQVLLAYLRTVPFTVPEFAHGLFDLAARARALSSAVAALQRVGDRPPLNAVPWEGVFHEQLKRAPDAWRGASIQLLRGSLLTEEGRIALLGATPEVWVGAEREIQFQLSVGNLCRWVTRNVPARLNASLRGSLVSAAIRAGAAAEMSNFVLTHGLRLTRELRDVSRDWLWMHPEEFQTHYLLVAWLEEGFETEDARPVVEQWCRRFKRHRNLSFVYSSWLNAGGDRELVRDSISDWLKVHATAEVAQFVYNSWLDTGGDRELVRDSIGDWLKVYATAEVANFVYKSWLEASGDMALIENTLPKWLKEHATTDAAGYVYKSWLQAGGSFAVIREPVLRWLRLNRDNVEAVYPLKYIADQPDLPQDSVVDVLHWCNRFAGSEDAIWRLGRLARYLKTPSLGHLALETCERVLPHGAFRLRYPPLAVRRATLGIIVGLVGNPALRIGELRGRVDTLLTRWLRHESALEDVRAPSFSQRAWFFQRVVDLLQSGELDVERDRSALVRFARWVNGWERQVKSDLHRTVTWLRAHHPSPEIWSEIRFPPTPSTGTYVPPEPDGR